MGDPDASEEVDVSGGLHQVHLGHDAAHLTGQRGQHFDGTGRGQRGSERELHLFLIKRRLLG